MPHVDTDSGWLSRLSKAEACENIVQQVDVYEAQDIGAWLKNLAQAKPVILHLLSALLVIISA